MRRQNFGRKIIAGVLAASLLLSPLNVNSPAAYAAEEQVETVSGDQATPGDEGQALVRSGHEQTPIVKLGSENQKSVSVSFNTTNLEVSGDTATVLTGQTFGLKIEFNNNNVLSGNLVVKLKASTDRLKITQMQTTSDQAIQFTGLEAPVSENGSYIYTLSANIPSSFAGTFTLSFSFTAGSAKTGDNVTIDTVSLGGENIEITGIKTVSARTNGLSVTVTNDIEKGTSKTKADSKGSGNSFYEVFDTSEITVNSSITNETISDATVLNRDFSVEKKITFKNFSIPYTDSWVEDYSVENTFTYSVSPDVSYTAVSENGYITGFTAKYSVSDSKIENLSSWETTFTLKNAVFTGGTPEIDAVTELTAAAVQGEEEKTFTSEQKECTASPHVVIDAKQDKVAVTNSANAVSYTVTGSFTTNGIDSRILRISGETETVSNNYEGDKFDKSNIEVVLKDSSGKEYGSTYYTNEDITNGFQFHFNSLSANEYTFEVKYTATLKNPEAEQEGTEWKNTYSIVDAGGNTVDGKSKTLTVAYRHIIDTDASVAIKKTGKQAADNKSIEYDIDLTNSEDEAIVSAITEYWPQEIPLKTISNVQDCEIVFLSGNSVLGAYNSTSDTFTVPDTLLKDSKQRTAFDTIEVNYINIEAGGETTLTFTGESGTYTKGCIQNRAAVVSGGSSTEILLFGAEMTKKAYKNKECTELVTDSDLLKPGATVYFEISLTSTSTNTYTLYEMPDDDLEFVAAYQGGTEISGLSCNDASGGTMSFNAVTISENSTCKWVMEYKIKEASTKKEVVNSAYAKTYVENVGDVKIPNCSYSVQLNYKKNADVSISKRVYPYLVQTEASSFSNAGISYNARFLTGKYSERRKSSEATGDDYVAYEITVKIWGLTRLISMKSRIRFLRALHM